MTVNAFKANIKLIGFSHDISAFTYTNENYITIYIYIFPSLQALCRTKKFVYAFRWA